MHDLGVYRKGTWLCHYTNWKLLWQPKLNYALESHCLFTLSLHWQLTSKAQNCNQSCKLSWGKSHVNTDGQQLHTTTPLGRTHCPVYLEWVLSLRQPLPFSIGGLRRMDGQKSPNDCSNSSAYALRRGLTTTGEQYNHRQLLATSTTTGNCYNYEPLMATSTTILETMF